MKTKKKKARITSISVSRLYNTGNYTNVKYDLSAEIPEGVSVWETLRQLVNTLTLLKPISKPTHYDMFKTESAKLESEQSEYVKEHLPEWREEVEQFEARKAARDQALIDLDNLGGTSVRRDAKNTWQDDDEYF